MRQSAGKYRHYSRTDRIADAIQREVGMFLITEIKDPRIGFVTVLRVQVSADLRHAKIHVSVLGDEARKTEAMRGLVAASGFVQRMLADRLDIRYTPKISFLLDESMEHAAKINALLKGLEG